ncbi:MAG: hypothetical protein JXR48_07035 [Candidatus Delongbacteria bacterium]|nr:hypothetical protein [Candidatus Delongbacteria bacterium]
MKNIFWFVVTLCISIFFVFSACKTVILLPIDNAPEKISKDDTLIVVVFEDYTSDIQSNPQSFKWPRRIELMNDQFPFISINFISTLEEKFMLKMKDNNSVFYPDYPNDDKSVNFKHFSLSQSGEYFHIFFFYNKLPAGTYKIKDISTSTYEIKGQTLADSGSNHWKFEYGSTGSSNIIKDGKSHLKLNVKPGELTLFPYSFYKDQLGNINIKDVNNKDLAIYQNLANKIDNISQWINLRDSE